MNLNFSTENPENRNPVFTNVLEALRRIGEPTTLVRRGQDWVVGTEGAEDSESPKMVRVPPCPLERLGNPRFLNDLGLRYPCLAGSMAHGISSIAMAEAMAEAGMLGFFGAAGLNLDEVSRAVDRLNRSLGPGRFGVNLIYSPNEPELEAAVADLLLNRGVVLAEASAYMDLSLPLVRYRVTGLTEDPSGRIVAPNRIVAKASRAEVAARFFAPPPERMIAELVRRGEIDRRTAELSGRIPMAQDLTAEADSGGHTDNQSALTLFPTLLAVRDRCQDRYRFDPPLRLGAAGGIASPVSAGAAFAMGAAYVMTGSVNQGAVESGTSPQVRDMLAKATQADVAMAPAADMFEMGIRVQVLKWGTMFPMRAGRLFDLYKSCAGLDDLSAGDRRNLEQNFFKKPLDQVWQETRDFFEKRDPSQVRRALEDPKHQLALVFRWYLGQAARWACAGVDDRRLDYQIYCGPSMGAFNEWVKGSFLEPPEHRRVGDIALNILFGAAVLTRINVLRLLGADLGLGSEALRPLPVARIKEYLR